MNTLSELLKKLKALPTGNVYKKIINGKVYYYHQYFLDGKRISNKVKDNELDILKKQIQERIEIENQIKNIRLRNTSLSKNCKELTGYVMNKNEVVAKFEKGVLVSINETLAPLVIKTTHSLEKFLELRVIDMSRTNARILKKVLNMDFDEDYKASLYSYALSVSDHYWFKPKHSKLKYNEVNFDNDALFEIALKGEVNVYFNKAKLSPEITTTGSFEKGWRYIDNEWWLYKSGNANQLFSELFSCKFAELIGVNTVKYELEDKYIKCKNFSPIYNFEPIASLADSNDNYENIFSILINIDRYLARDYLKLIFFDTVVNNIDRHNENMGLLRNADNGQIISLAPNFDNNLSLLATNEVINTDMRQDGFAKLFINFLIKNDEARKLFKTIQFKPIEIMDIQNIVNTIPLEVPHKEDIANNVFKRYNFIKNMFD